MICSRKKSDILVKHMFPAVSLQPHHKRLSKFKADLIINFGPGRVCLSSHFSSQTTCLNLHYRDLGILCFHPIFLDDHSIDLCQCRLYGKVFPILVFSAVFFTFYFFTFFKNNLPQSQPQRPHNTLHRPPHRRRRCLSTRRSPRPRSR